MTSLPDFCPKSIYTGDNQELIKLHSCKDAANCMTNIANENKRINNANEYNRSEYKNALNRYRDNKSRFEHLLNAWRNKKINLENEVRYFNNCALWWPDVTGTRHDLCEISHGERWYHFGGEGAGIKGGCIEGQGKGACKRNNRRVLDELMDAGFTAEEPRFFEIEPTQSQYPLQELLSIDNLIINCCSNYISAGNRSDIINNIQECSTSIDRHIENTETRIKDEEKRKKEHEQLVKDSETVKKTYADTIKNIKTNRSAMISYFDRNRPIFTRYILISIVTLILSILIGCSMFIMK